MQYEQKKEIPLWVFRVLMTMGFVGSVVLAFVALVLGVMIGAEGTTTGILVMILGFGSWWLIRQEILNKLEPISKRELAQQTKQAEYEFTICSQHILTTWALGRQVVQDWNATSEYSHYREFGPTWSGRRLNRDWQRNRLNDFKRQFAVEFNR